MAVQKATGVTSIKVYQLIIIGMVGVFLGCASNKHRLQVLDATGQPAVGQSVTKTYIGVYPLGIPERKVSKTNTDGIAIMQLDDRRAMLGIGSGWISCGTLIDSPGKAHEVYRMTESGEAIKSGFQVVFDDGTSATVLAASIRCGLWCIPLQNKSFIRPLPDAWAPNPGRRSRVRVYFF